MRSLLLTLIVVISLFFSPSLLMSEPPSTLSRALLSPLQGGRRWYDRHGQLLRAETYTHLDKRGARLGSTPLSQISPWVGRSLVCLEDRTFWSHQGIPFRGALRAIWQNIRHSARRIGGSGLTQQLVKLERGRAKGLWDKLKEARYALWLNAHLTKEEQLERYLNRASFGGAMIGVTEASLRYFNLDPDQLSLAQAALLAALPHAPARLDPRKHLDRAIARQRKALRCLRAEGLIEQAQLERALSENVVIGDHPLPFEAPHAIETLIHKTPPLHDTLQVGGDIQLTLDLKLQHAAEGRIDRYLQMYRRDIKQLAAVGLHVETGEVLFWIGSRGFNHPAAGQVDHILGLRLPGSTLKPFLYGLALDRGFTMESMLPDRPLYFQTSAGHYQPSNYNHKTRGEVRFMSALPMSLNIPSVWLLNQIGVSPFLETLRASGLKSLTRDAEHYGLGLSLGDGEVSLIDLTNAYRGLAQGGRWSPWRLLQHLSSDPPLEEASFLSERASQVILHLLSSTQLRAPAFGVDGPLTRPYPCAVKTGTSQGYTDTWTIGVNAHFAVGVWIQPRAGVHKSGGQLAAPLWAELFDILQADSQSEALPSSALSPRDQLSLNTVISSERAFYASPVNIPWLNQEEQNDVERAMSQRSGQTQGRLFRIMSPPEGAVLNLLPEDDPLKARLKAEAEWLSDLSTMRRSSSRLSWSLNGTLLPASQENPLVTWFNPWRNPRRINQLCLKLTDGSSSQAQEESCVTFLTLRN